MDGVTIVNLFGVNDAVLQDAITNGAQRRLAAEEHMRVFEETRAMRARANDAVLGEGYEIDTGDEVIK